MKSSLQYLLPARSTTRAPLPPPRTRCRVEDSGAPSSLDREREREREPSAAERGREQPKRWRPCGDSTMIEALSVSLRLSTDVVARENFTSRSPLDSFRVPLFLLSSSSSLLLSSLSLSRLVLGDGLSNSPQGRQRWRRFLARAHA